MDEHLAGMRDPYDGGGLDERALAPTWLAQLQRWLGDAVEAGLPEPNAMMLATGDPGGAPSVRTVLLKGLDERGLVFHTNLRSRKGRDLAENPRAALVFPWLAMHRQVVVEGGVSPIDAADSDAYFASRPRGARLAALASPQSEPIAGREELERRFAEAGRAHPAEVPRPQWWGGLRVAPSTVELWQGRPDRLHDRLRYRSTGGSTWVVERLAP